ncbi:UDP-N-acetylglucosamine 2-epimerase-like protein [Leptospira interrogans serovar Pyrogenes str. 200701872]|uniref:UDP-N-acetylglucosamine 2-epimerase-like protein n=1 Tax=Leptospira interrogans serovar Pyrogenes str. 200701872 TaxID=1193029 RepID=M6ZUE3_LEPIR|nr:UDP-N-acetylglucosamine 2-epimerase-like protein [Leptospira interrogans serovar Pyrogenes str. 200701872]
MILEISKSSKLDLQIIATGMHLSPEFGLTYKEIENDGFLIHKKIEILLSSDSTVGVSKSIGLGLIGFSEAFCRFKSRYYISPGGSFRNSCSDRGGFDFENSSCAFAWR